MNKVEKNTTKIVLFEYCRGLTLVELLVTLALSSIIMAGLVGVMSNSLQVQSVTQSRNELSRQARFAMQRMSTAVLNSNRLILPLSDNPATNWSEHIREQSVPASTPEGSSTFATSVLAVTLNPYQDLDADGWSDANNDKDFDDLNGNTIRDANEPERIDEDLPADNNNDNAPGIAGIDDNGDGFADDSTAGNGDDDEDDNNDEDGSRVGDEDRDWSTNEDIAADMNADGAPGLAFVDDDRDGSVDEGSVNDDDEDGQSDEDPYDVVVFYLNGDQLIERLPAQIDVNNDSVVNGMDYTESTIAESVSYFRIERVDDSEQSAVIIQLTLTGITGGSLQLQTRARLGGRL